MTPEWEYDVQTVGSIWRGPSPDALARLLNSAAAEGWETMSVTSLANSSRLMIVLRRRLTRKTGRKRRDTWP